jgi:hypothetical protein
MIASFIRSDHNNFYSPLTTHHSPAQECVPMRHMGSRTQAKPHSSTTARLIKTPTAVPAHKKYTAP